MHSWRDEADELRGTTRLVSNSCCLRYLFITYIRLVLPRLDEADLPACSEGDGLINAHFLQGLAWLV